VTSRSFVVGAEELVEPRAHAVLDLGEQTVEKSVALCGFPADHLTIVRVLAWEDVAADVRCAFCHADLQRQP
jgi:hypothetical protein